MEDGCAAIVYKVAAGKLPLIVTSCQTSCIISVYLAYNFLCETTLLPFRVSFCVSASQFSQLPYSNHQHDSGMPVASSDGSAQLFRKLPEHANHIT